MDTGYVINAVIRQGSGTIVTGSGGRTVQNVGGVGTSAPLYFMKIGDPFYVQVRPANPTDSVLFCDSCAPAPDNSFSGTTSGNLIVNVYIVPKIPVPPDPTKAVAYSAIPLVVEPSKHIDIPTFQSPNPFNAPGIGLVSGGPGAPITSFSPTTPTTTILAQPDNTGWYILGALALLVGTAVIFGGRKRK